MSDTGNNENNGGSGDLTQELTQLKAELDQIKKSNEELGGAKESLERQLSEANKELLGEDYLEYLESKKGGNKGGDNSDSNTGFAGGDDFDRATNTEVAKLVVDHIDGKLKSVTENLDKRSKALEDKIGLAFAKLDVAMTKSKYDGNDGGPAWADHEDEIYKIAKANPSWGAEKCYRQFKLEHLDKQRNDAEEKKKKAQEEEDLITEKGGVPGSTTKQKDLSAEEAAEIAYRKAYGNKASAD